jgi:uncharacterized membrane protein YhaH (DUF805 family)
MNWYLEVLKKYAVFSGRASRTEYWMFVLFNIIFAIAAMVIDNLSGLATERIESGPVYSLYVLATLVPSLAVSARRLHDTGKSGLYLLLGLIPCVGIILLAFMITPGNIGANEYGEDPDAYSIT